MSVSNRQYLGALKLLVGRQQMHHVNKKRDGVALSMTDRQPTRKRKMVTELLNEQMNH